MRRLGWGIAAAVVGWYALVTWGNPRDGAPATQPSTQLSTQSVAQPATPAVKPLVLSDGMIALSSDTADHRQQVVVIDSKSRVMSVYHVEHASGVISLKSVRSLSADLMMDEFNTESPLPREIRAILQKK